MPLAIRRLFFCCAILALGLLGGCQSKFMYFPRPYGAEHVARWQRETHGALVKCTTADGHQQAYLLRPAQGAPERLWIVCGGNGTLALDWSDWFRAHGPGRDAFLLVDFPAYGACEGTPRPASIRRTMQAMVPAACAELGWSLERDRGRLRFFGHSLGGAAALIAAREFDIRRGVLVSTFTSMMDMAQHLTGLPIGFLVVHRFNNLARLHEIAAQDGSLIYLFHGSDDEVIPASMAKALAAAAPKTVRLEIIPGGRHNDLQEKAAGKIEAAMREVRK
jgi:pimeloyl-ACP methyl ester carboxylesterase